MQKDIQAFGFTNLEMLLLSFYYLLFSYNIFVFIRLHFHILFIERSLINSTINFYNLLLFYFFKDQLIKFLVLFFELYNFTCRNI